MELKGTATVIGGMILIGCAALGSNQMDPVPAHPSNQYDEKARKNLSAIRALLLEQRQYQFASPQEQATHPVPAPETEWPPISQGNVASLMTVHAGSSAPPPLGTRKAPGDVTIKAP